MANQITIPVLQQTTYGLGDKIELEINGAAEPDLLRMWGPQRRTMGFGHSPFGSRRLGIDHGPGFGRGPFGVGTMGTGVAVIYFKSTTAFPAGDYSVRARAYDSLGNVGNWSAAETVPHRPTPAAPKALAINPATGELCWTWDQDDG